MNNVDMPSTSTVDQRQLASSAAIASVEAEGLTPTAATIERLAQYVSGKLTADQLYQQTLAAIKARTKQMAS